MPSQQIIYLIKEHFGPGILLLGILCLLVVIFATFLAKDMRMTICLFLLAIAFSASVNPVIHLGCYIVRWLILGLISARLLLGRNKIKLSLIQILFLLWVIVAIISAFQAPSRFRGLVFGAVYFLCFLVFLVSMVSEIETEEQIRGWFKMFSFLSWLYIVFSFALFIMNPYEFSYTGRQGLLFGNANITGRILLFAATVFLWKGLRQKGRLAYQLICYTMTILAAFLVFLSGSRGAIAGFAITLLVFALHYRKKVAVVIIPLLVISGFYIVPKVMAIATERFVEHVTSVEATSRQELRELGIQRFKEKPILGWGLGSLSDTRADVCPVFVSFHNSYLNYLVEFGTPGFLVVMTVLIYTYLRLWRLALFLARSEYIRDVSWFILAMLTVMFAWNYFDGALSGLSSNHFYWLILLIAFTECMVRVNRQIEIEHSVIGEYSPETEQSYDSITANSVY